MSHKIVKLLVNDDGDTIPVKNQVWHYSHVSSNTEETFCTGECYGIGESSAKFIELTVERGGITCPQCLAKIKTIQSIKLGR